MSGNWFHDEYSMLAIGIAECQPVNGKFCNSSSEIATWLSERPNFFISQESNVDPEMFSDSNKTEKWPHSLRPKENYYPTVVS